MSTALDFPPPLVVLSPPRSFSSLTSAMLGAHPQSAGLPELQLFMTDHMDPLLKFFALSPGNLQDGLLRSVAQLYFGEQTDASVDQATGWLAERRHLSTAAMFQLLARKEGIIPALESSHALAYALNMADEAEDDTIIVVNLSGRGDKDLGHVIGILGDQVNG